MSFTTLSALVVLALAAIGSCSPIKSDDLEDRLTNRIHYSPGSSNHFEDDFLVRQVRKDSKRINAFEPYLMFKELPPTELTLAANSRYTLECEASGTPKPIISWERDGKIINQTYSTVSYEDVSHVGQLALSLVKSRLFLDCLPENEKEIHYTCVAETAFKTIRANTKIIIRPMSAEDQSLLQRELEFLSNMNSVDKPGTNSNSLSSQESTLTGCLSKKSLGSPARIYFWTLTTLENIGSDAIISCRATGYPRPTITWYDSSDELLVPDYRKYQILKSGDLLIRNITFEDMGKYQCVAKNQHGTDSIDKIFFYPTEPVTTTESDK